jgi:hypothetical protein
MPKSFIRDTQCSPLDLWGEKFHQVTAVVNLKRLQRDEKFYIFHAVSDAASSSMMLANFSVQS